MCRRKSQPDNMQHTAQLFKFFFTMLVYGVSSMFRDNSNIVAFKQIELETAAPSKKALHVPSSLSISEHN